MKADVFDLNNKKVREIELPREVFEVEWNPELVRQVWYVEQSNAYRQTAKTKDRSEVRGGGRKPWRQKGTGRARHGSIRSPIWVGGGVAFGPTLEKNRQRRINKKMKRKAILALLSQKLRDEEIKFVDSFKLETPKTKFLAAALKLLLPEKFSSALLVYKSPQDKSITNLVRNIPKVRALSAPNLNVRTLLNHKYLLISADSLAELEMFYQKLNRQAEKTATEKADPKTKAEAVTEK